MTHPLAKLYILRDVDNNDNGEPYETGPHPLPMLADYIDGPLLSDVDEDWREDCRRIAAEMREGRLSDGDQQILLEMSVHIRDAEATA